MAKYSLHYHLANLLNRTTTKIFDIKKLQSDPVLIRPKLASVLIQSDPVLIRAHL